MHGLAAGRQGTALRQTRRIPYENRPPEQEVVAKVLGLAEAHALVDVRRLVRRRLRRTRHVSAPAALR